MSRTRLLLSLVLLLTAISLKAQDQDFRLWTEASIEKALNKKISVFFVEEFRWDKNASTFDSWHNSLGMHYSFNKYFRLRSFYRYSLNSTLKSGMQKSHRLAFDAVFRYKIKRFIIRDRVRYQSDFADVKYQNGLSIEARYLRNRIGVKYDIRKTKIMPFVNYEFYLNLKNIYGTAVERHRITGGLDYDFSDNFSGSIYYRYQKTSGNFIDASNIYVLGFSVGYEF